MIFMIIRGKLMVIRAKTKVLFCTKLFFYHYLMIFLSIQYLTIIAVMFNSLFLFYHIFMFNSLFLFFSSIIFVRL